MATPKSIVSLWIAVLLLPLACNRSERPSPREGAAATGKSEARELDPCALLTPAEAGQFLGGTAVPKQTQALSNVSSCIWEAQAPLRGLQIMVSTPAQLRTDPTLSEIGINTIEQRFQQLTFQVPDGKGGPVPGLGDAALWRGDLDQLWIMKRGKALITVSFHNRSELADALDQSTAVASRVLSRI